MMQEPWLQSYRLITTALGPIAPALLALRRRKGKEDARRMSERLGFAGAQRDGKPVAWMHGASVGEGLALMPLVERLVERGFQVLVTTGTVTSAAVIASRLPAGAVHQYVPLDVPKFFVRFLDHWRPAIALVAESELWPNMLNETNLRRIPLVLVNARLSERSFLRWQKFPRVIGALLRRIDLCLAQSQEDAGRLVQLGAPRVQVAGNLKYDVAAPPVDNARLAAIAASIGSRPIWIAASTHAGEEAIAIEAHQQLAKRFGLLTIIAPRHPERGPEIAALAAGLGEQVVLRSSGPDPDRNSGVYVADTMGEMGLFYRLANVVFLGKSLTSGGGQNPIEPAKLGCAILHGSRVENFADVYRELDQARAAIEVGDADTLGRALALLFNDSASARRLARSASEVVEKLAGATDNIMGALEPYFMQMRVERR